MTCVANDGLSAGEAPTTATPRGENRSASGGFLVSTRGSYSPRTEGARQAGAGQRQGWRQSHVPGPLPDEGGQGRHVVAGRGRWQSYGVSPPCNLVLGRRGRVLTPARRLCRRGERSLLIQPPVVLLDCSIGSGSGVFESLLRLLGTVQHLLHGAQHILVDLREGAEQGSKRGGCD